MNVSRPAGCVLLALAIVSVAGISAPRAQTGERPNAKIFIGSVADTGQFLPDTTVLVRVGPRTTTVFAYRDAYFAIVDEAHKLGISFVGHVPDAIRVEEASDAGQKSIEHLSGVDIAVSRDEAVIQAETMAALAKHEFPVPDGQRLTATEITNQREDALHLAPGRASLG